jgi:hypothetical protein
VRDLIVSGRIADVILVVMALEGLVLGWLWRGDGAGRLLSLVGNLAGGGFLVLALKAALTGADWGWIAAALIGSMFGHGLDVVTRLAKPSA